MGIIFGLVVLASIGALASYQWNRDLDVSKSARSRAVAACETIQDSPVTLDEMQEARAAFEEDKQVAVSVAARQAESAMANAAAPDADVIDSVRRVCRETYESSE